MLKKFISVLVFFFVVPAQAEPFRIAIDPGHGGTDEGTVFLDGTKRITEKEITLQLSQQISYLLRAKGYRVTLTRDSDHEVALPSRTALANRWGADVFLSIHMNSTDHNSPSAEGVETFILNNTTDASSKRLAHLENSVFTTQTAESAEQPDVALILKDLTLDANLSRSRQLACFVQDQLVRTRQYSTSPVRRNRGVKQALFHVLLGADMPSILVEAGFLNSFRDRTLVTSRQGQFKIAHAVAEALDRYHSSISERPRANLISLNKCKVN